MKNTILKIFVLSVIFSLSFSVVEANVLTDVGNFFSNLITGKATESRCGNGVKDGNEVCDGDDFGRVTCKELGYAGGTLSCTSECDKIHTNRCLVQRDIEQPTETTTATPTPSSGGSSPESIPSGQGSASSMESGGGTGQQYPQIEIFEDCGVCVGDNMQIPDGGLILKGAIDNTTQWGAVTVDSNLDVIGRGKFVRESGGVVLDLESTESGGKYWIGINGLTADNQGGLWWAPFDDGDWQYERELGYNTDLNHWKAENGFSVIGGDLEVDGAISSPSGDVIIRLGENPTTSGVGGGCFLEGTLILTPNGEKSIENIKERDVVYSYNLETNSLVKNKVKKLLVHENYNDESVLLKLSNDEELFVTLNHPFYDMESDSYRELREFSVGDKLSYYSEGVLKEIKIEEIKGLGRFDITYNLELNEPNNYFANRVLVHNKQGPSSSIAEQIPE